MGKPEEDLLYAPVEIWSENDMISQEVLDDTWHQLRTTFTIMRNGALWDQRTANAGGRFRIMPFVKEPQFYFMLSLVSRHRDAVVPSRTHVQDVGLDIHLIEAKEGEHGVWGFRTGWTMAPPLGYFLLIAERSSTHQHGWSLANKVGIIDPNYRGEVYVVMSKLWATAVVPALPWKAVQLIALPYATLNICVMGSMSTTDRGEAGFGSTDKREPHYYEYRSAESRPLGRMETSSHNIILDFIPWKIQADASQIATTHEANQQHPHTPSGAAPAARIAANRSHPIRRGNRRISPTGRPIDLRASTTERRTRNRTGTTSHQQERIVVEFGEGWWWKILLGWLVLIISVTAILARVQEAQNQKQSRQPLQEAMTFQDSRNFTA
jgi:dUTP pyrophosphatase